MSDFSALDNPAWYSLATTHDHLAQSHGLARRYPADVSPFAAMHWPTAAAFADLAALVNPGEGVGLCTSRLVDVPDGWEVVRARLIEQMICTEPNDNPPASTPLRLAEADVPEMLALTAATEPGPFLAATTRMGSYWGIRSDDGRLMAMAGERLKPRGFVEISAVCTDPEFRGRGHARSLVRFLMDRIFAEGAVPILHVKAENNAKGLYERLGFYLRHTMHLTVIVRRA